MVVLPGDRVVARMRAGVAPVTAEVVALVGRAAHRRARTGRWRPRPRPRWRTPWPAATAIEPRAASAASAARRPISSSVAAADASSASAARTLRASRPNWLDRVRVLARAARPSRRGRPRRTAAPWCGRTAGRRSARRPRCRPRSRRARAVPGRQAAGVPRTPARTERPVPGRRARRRTWPSRSRWPAGPSRSSRRRGDARRVTLDEREHEMAFVVERGDADPAGRDRAGGVVLAAVKAHLAVGPAHPGLQVLGVVSAAFGQGVAEPAARQRRANSAAPAGTRCRRRQARRPSGNAPAAPARWPDRPRRSSGSPRRARWQAGRARRARAAR